VGQYQVEKTKNFPYLLSSLDHLIMAGSKLTFAKDLDIPLKSKPTIASTVNYTPIKPSLVPYNKNNSFTTLSTEDRNPAELADIDPNNANGNNQKILYGGFTEKDSKIEDDKDGDYTSVNYYHGSSSIKGMEDEYVPNYEFNQDILKNWFSSQDLANENVEKKRNLEDDVLKELHSQAIPISVPKNHKKRDMEKKVDAKKIDEWNEPVDIDKLSQLIGSPPRDFDEKILNEIPFNFQEFSFSERKKFLTKIIPSELRNNDYKNHLTKLIKAKFKSKGNNLSSSSSLSSKKASPAMLFLNNMSSKVRVTMDKNGLPSRTDLSNEPVPPNSNRLGSVVMGYKLGNVIGFGAWGTVRECCKYTGVASIADSTTTSRAASYAPSRRSSLALSFVLDPKSQQFRSNYSNPPASGYTNAMKITSCGSESLMNEFLREIKVWEKMNHPNLLPLLNWTQANGNIFALTIKCSGGTLFDLVDFWSHSSPDQAVIRKYMIDIANALQYMHGLDYIHGDVKLENCLLDITISYHELTKDNCGNCILCDFGMARSLEDIKIERKVNVRNKASFHIGTPPRRGRSKTPTLSLGRTLSSKEVVSELSSQLQKIKDQQNYSSSETLTSADTSPNASLPKLYRNSASPEKSPSIHPLPDCNIGSLPYAAPELLVDPDCPRCYLSKESDIWSLGVMIYTMISGKLPFTNSSDEVLKELIKKGDVDYSIAESRGKEFTPLVNIVKGCLKGDPKERFTLKEILDRLLATDAPFG